MSLTLHMHPLASFCWKVLIALYENDTPFEARLVNLGDPDEAAAFKALWPTGKMPVLRDAARDRTVPETTIIIEYLQTWYPGPVRFIPEDPEAALRARLFDRLFDCYVQEPMQKIVGDRIRPADAKDRTAWPTPAPSWPWPMTCSRRSWRDERGRPARLSVWPTARRPRPCSTPTRSRP
jgi:glutathione S-transferase